jgi:hypothetical protein
MPGDIVINEVLFNPFDGGVDFIELFNRSGKVLEADKLKFSAYDTIISKPKTVISINSGSYLLLPRSFCVLTTAAQNVTKFYKNVDTRAFMPDLPALPSYNNDDGIVMLMLPDETITDSFRYRENMHFSLLNNMKGISLERINPWSSTNDPSNWHSASTGSGYATPGLKNSQYHIFEAEEGSLSIEPKVFSPDNDGYNDLLFISYQTAGPGYAGHIRIFDDKGRLVRHLVNNEILGSNGIYVWDGFNEQGGISKMGVYFILLEMHSLKGKIERHRKAFVLARII